MKKVAIVTTGGTIASRLEAGTGAVVAKVKGSQLLETVPGLDQIAQIELHDFSLVPGWNITPPMMLELSRVIDGLLNSPEYSGAVVTHGTDMIEETAYFLDLVLKTDKPVVVTGAMRHGSEPDGDGPRNLRSAVTVAACEDAQGQGVLVVLNDEIHGAEDATKMHATSVSTFESPEFGPLGALILGQPVFNRRSFSRSKIQTDRIDTAVDLIKTAAGMDDRLVRYALSEGASGLVIEGTGAGNVPATMVPGVMEAIARKIPVVIVSRCPEGAVAPIYGREGGGKLMQEAGAILGGRLSGQKARLKLMVALGSTSDVQEIRRLFEG
ncbi:MAG: asparaginase [Chloroflexi bacterium]|nr:asparaginase [Chloroflexota bacterium]